jgi:uncharacterized membrane protein YgcG
MVLAYSRSRLLAALLVFHAAACSDSRDEARTQAGGPNDPHVLGTAQDAYCTNHTITNVVILPGTYHWEDPLHLIDSAEGFGPRSLNLTISDSISPSASESSSYTPTNSEISSSVGYDISASFSIEAASSILVPFGAYARLEAFATFQMTTWDIVGTNCFGAPDIGTGVSYKPVGVYFKTCQDYICLMGGDAIGTGPVPSYPGSTGGAGGGTGGSGSTGTGSSSGSGAGGA